MRGNKLRYNKHYSKKQYHCRDSSDSNYEEKFCDIVSKFDNELEKEKKLFDESIVKSINENKNFFNYIFKTKNKEVNNYE